MRDSSKTSWIHNKWHTQPQTPGTSLPNRRSFCGTLLVAILTGAGMLGALSSSGQEILGLSDTLWKFHQLDTDISGAGWMNPGYGDGSWPVGQAVLAYENNAAVTPLIRTTLRDPMTYSPQGHATYFRTHFSSWNNPEGVVLTFSNLIDDGAVFYLNGVEVGRVLMSGVPATFSSVTTNCAIEGEWPVFSFTNFSGGPLLYGDNLLAVELHQCAATSSDTVFGSVLSLVSLSGRPLIARQPAGTNVMLGATAVLGVSASGNPSPSYQWRHQGTNLPGATGATLVLPSVQRNQGGSYSVVVSNSIGTVTSQVAVLTVVLPPTVIGSVVVSSGAFTFSFGSYPGESYEVQASSSIETPLWFPVANFLASAYLTSFTDPMPPAPSRLYRVRVGSGEVYSVNSVGFKNVALMTGSNYVVNPFRGASDRLDAIIPTAPDGTEVLRWDAATQLWQWSLYIEGFGWIDENFDPSQMILPPGQPFVVNPSAAFTLTLFGELIVGSGPAPPRVLSQTPSSATNRPVSQIVLNLSAPVVGLEARSAGNYTLLDLGPDRLAATGDERLVPVAPAYADGSSQIQLLVMGTNRLDLRTWRELDYENGKSGYWIVDTNGLSVLQTSNASLPTFFISDQDYVGRQFIGRVRVEPDTDDDFIGVVFAFQTNAVNGKPDSYYYLSWKRLNQVVVGNTNYGEAGFKLLKITASAAMTTNNIRDLMWDGETTANIQVLARLDGTNTLGWAYQTDYDFSVFHDTNGQVAVSIRQTANGAVLWQAAVLDPDPLGPGKLGFLNHSQRNVLYSGLAQTDALREGVYQLTVRSGNPGLRDAEGRFLDGNGDGVGGDDYASRFLVDWTAPSVGGASLTLAILVVNYLDAGGMDAQAVTGFMNYVLRASGRDGTFGDGNEVILNDRISNVTYDPGSGAAVLQLSPALGEEVYEFTILANGVRDLAGNRLASGTNWVTTFTNLSSADLVVEEVALPSVAEFGQSITVSWRVRNQGSAPATALWADRLVLSSDLVVGNDTPLTTQPALASLQPGAGYLASTLVTLPISANLGSGDYFILVTTDSGQIQPEANENNNTAPSPTIHLTLPPLPDLSVTSITAPPEAVAGQTIQVSWILTNSGAGEATGPWLDEVYLSTDALVGGDQLVGSFPFNGTIPSGQSALRIQNVTLPFGISGPRWIVVRTDAANRVVEHAAETNNVRLREPALTVLAVPTPNLRVMWVAAPTNAYSGQQTEVRWAITNSGTGPTGAAQWFDTVYLSSDTNWDGADVLLGETNNASYLGTGEAYQSALTVTIPQGLEGSYYYVVRTDPYNQVSEGPNEGDNLGVSQASPVILPPLPDLQVTSVQGPSVAFSEQSVSISWTVTNAGPGRTLEGSWMDEVFLSPTNSLVAGAISLGTLRYQGVLLEGDRYTTNLLVTLPQGVSGSFYFVVRADARNEVFEHALEGNNNGAKLSPTTVRLTPPPDLVVLDIQAPLEAMSAQQIQVSWSIANQGAGDCARAFKDQVFLSSDAALGGDVFLGEFEVTGGIPAGESIQRSQIVRLPSDRVGLQWIIIRTDAHNTVYEHDAEGNNTGVDDHPLTIRPLPAPNLRVGRIIPPVSAFSGQQVLVQWAVTNAGSGSTSAGAWRDRVWLSPDPVLNLDTDTLLGEAPNASYLNPGEVYLNSLTARIPQGVEGDYYVIVMTDANNQVNEGADDQDNTGLSSLVRVNLSPPPDLQVSAVMAPAAAFSGQEAFVSWTVTNAGPGRTEETSWSDEIFFSTNRTLDASDLSLGTLTHQAALNSGAAYTVTNHTVCLPIGRAGEFYFLVRADTRSEVYEHIYEQNNVSNATTPTVVHLTPPPDLAALFVEAPASALAGQEFTASYAVANLGTTATPNSWWQDRLYLSPGPVLNTNTALVIASRAHGGALEPDAAYTNSLSGVLPDQLSGTYYAFILTDCDGEVFELVRTNNILAGADAVTVQIKAPDLVVTRFLSPEAAEAGQPLLVSWTVANVGLGDTPDRTWNDALILSSDLALGNSDDRVLLRQLRQQPLTLGGQYSVSNQWVSLPFSIVPGAYQLFLTSDLDNAIYEGDHEANNSFGPIPVTISRNTADFRVVSVTVLAAAQSEDTVTVGWVTRNFGMGAPNAPWWSDSVYLSTDPVLDAGDRFLGAREFSGAVAPGTYYTNTATIQLPAEFAGSFYVIIHADADDRIVEGEFEANNTLASTNVVVMTLRPAPDLVVTAVQAPTDAFSGQSLSLTWTVQNTGVGPANRTWYDTVYLSLDQFLDRETDLYLGYAARPHALSPGQSYTNATGFSIPPGISGPFFALVVADGSEQVPERAYEANNTGSDPQVVQVHLQPPADLVAGLITVPVNGTPGQPASITYTVHNQGANAARGSWTDSLYLSADARWDIDDPLMGRVTHYGDVPGGASYSHTLTAPMPGVIPGDYHIIVRSDILNHIAELNETNNLGASLDSVRMDAEELIFGLGRTGSLATGQSVYYRFEATNGQTIRLRFSPQSPDSANELYVRFGQMPSRGQFDVAAHEPFMAALDLTVPITQTGTHYVLLHSTWNPAEPAYTIVAERLPFALTEVRPSLVGNAGYATLALEGSLFEPSTVFHLVLASNQVLVPAQTWPDNAARAYATFDLLGITPGAYAIRALRSDGSVALLPSALRVTEGRGAHVNLEVQGPLQVRADRLNKFMIFYGNDGDADTGAPLLLVESTSGSPLGTAPASVESRPLQVLGASLQGPIDVLSPGALHSAEVYYVSTWPSINITARAILDDDSNPVLNWQALGSAVRPTSISTADWAVFWSAIQSRLGPTWGDYVRMLNRLCKELSPPGSPIRDVRELFARLYVLNPAYHPTVQVEGQALESGAGTPVSGVPVNAYLRAQGRARYNAHAVSDASGRFVFSNLVPGTYDLVVEGWEMDADRDGAADGSFAVLVLTNTIGTTNVPFYCLPLPPEPPVAIEDVGASLAADSQGRAHLVWTHNGQVWHAINSGSGWINAGPVANASGYDPRLIYGATLHNGSAPGVAVVWQSGTGNESQLQFTTGEESESGFLWNVPQSLTGDGHGDAGAAIIEYNGHPLVLWLQRDYGIEDDDDVYFLIVTNAAGVPWQASSEGSSVRKREFGRCWSANFGTEKVRIPVVGKGFKLTAQGEACFTVGTCSATASGSLGVSTDLGDHAAVAVASQVEGRVVARKSKSTGVCGWELDYFKFGPNIQGEFHIPYPPLTWKVGHYGMDVGLRVVLFGGGNVVWKGPNVFRWPPDEATITVGLGGGPYGRARWWSRYAEVYGEISGSGTYTMPPGRWSFDGVTVRACVVGNNHSIREKGRCWVFTISGESETTPAPKSLGSALQSIVKSAASAQFGTTSAILKEDGLTVTYSETDRIRILNGTGAIYEGQPVLASVGTDIKDDGKPSLASTSTGEALAAWTKDSANPEAAIGSAVVVASYSDGSWAPPVTVDGLTNFNHDPAVAVGSDDVPMLVWASAPANVTINSSLSEIDAALDATDLVYARRVDGVWTPPALLAAVPGPDSRVVLAAGPSGQLVAAWINNAETNPAVYATLWTGSSWTPAVQISTAAVAQDPAVGFLGAKPMVVWSQALDDTNSAPGSAALYQSVFVTQWSEAERISVLTEAGKMLAATESTQTASAVKGGQTRSSSLPLPPPPPWCCNCDKCTATQDPGPTSGRECVIDRFCDPATCVETVSYGPCPVRPVDPNDILGPAGFGLDHWVPLNTPLSYTIRFENDPARATAPAQGVLIVQALDSDLDLRTFRLGDFGFGDVFVDVPENRAFYTTRLDLRATQGVFVDVAAGVDVTTGEAFWQFMAIDPMTGELPRDAQIGFLPPNLNPPEGEGFVSFRIRPKAGLSTGTRIDAEAVIIFDTEAPIATPPIFNTVEAGAPLSQVLPLPEIAPEPVFPVAWTGSDDGGGSGLASYDIYVSQNGGAFKLWLAQTTLSTAPYAGARGLSYRFYSVARDNAGNVEAPPPTPDAETAVSDNSAPVLQPVPDLLARVRTALWWTNTATDLESPPQSVTFSLDPGAPSGATVNPTTGLFQWRPNPAYGSTTNWITLRATDNGVPPLAGIRTFAVAVADYVEPSLGTLAVLAGSNGCVPMVVMASTGVTNLSAALDYDGTRLTNLDITVLSPLISEAELQELAAGRAQLSLTTHAGYALQGTQEVARICFGTVQGRPSAFTSLNLSNVIARKLDGTVVADIGVGAGRIAILSEAPLLVAALTSETAVRLLLYGTPGVRYLLESTIDPTVSTGWSPTHDMTLSNLVQTITVTNTAAPRGFWRAVRP